MALSRWPNAHCTSSLTFIKGYAKQQFIELYGFAI
jgi:hypothetical protein